MAIQIEPDQHYRERLLSVDLPDELRISVAIAIGRELDFYGEVAGLGRCAIDLNTLKLIPVPGESAADDPRIQPLLRATIGRQANTIEFLRGVIETLKAEIDGLRSTGPGPIVGAGAALSAAMRAPIHADPREFADNGAAP